MRAAWVLTLALAFYFAVVSLRDESRAQAVQSVQSAAERSDLSDALSPAEWQQVDASIERALEWIARNQQPDGSFPTIASGQPAVTSHPLGATTVGSEARGNGASFQPSKANADESGSTGKGVAMPWWRWFCRT